MAQVEYKNAEGGPPFGVTFPEFCDKKHHLGRKLRLFAPDKATMDKLALSSWLEQLTDYIHITSIRTVPEGAGTVCYRRVQTKSNPDRLIRRAARRQGITVEQAEAQRKSTELQLTRAPYIRMKSCSSNRSFRLFITQKIGLNEGGSNFTLYGLSSSAQMSSLPYF